jgi:hypothetical protein
MTQSFSVNENNDIFIGRNGNLAIARDLEAVLQICAQVAKAQRGEMVFRVTDGIPNFQTIWNGKPNIAQFNAALRKAILSVPDVTNIKELTTAIQNNVLRYRITIETIYGEGLVNG